MPYPYTPPPFLLGQSADEIHKRMLDSLPADIDKGELQIPYDFTRPAALEKAEFVEYELNETIKIMFAQWAYGKWLDYHAQTAGITRRPANKASGYVVVTGTHGMTIVRGFRFATAANINAGVVFEASETVVFDGPADTKGKTTVSVPVLAVDGGPGGNVPPDTIILMMKPDKNVTYVSNPDETSGGAPVEDDETLRARVIDAMRDGAGNTGCDADYVRWAKEVAGVRNVVADPEWDDPALPEAFHWTDEFGVRRCAGAVRLFVVDANGAPANRLILDEVYDHIVSPGDRGKRLAPIGASLTVAAPDALRVDISANITLYAGESLEGVRARLVTHLEAYWLEASTENDIRDVQSGNGRNYIKWVQVGAVLARTAGIADYSELTVNGGTGNVAIPLGAFPVTGEVALVEQP